jgi:TPR repeat protein
VLLVHACRTGDGPACLDLAGRYARGDGLPRDPERAAAAHERACVFGLAEGCVEFGNDHASGFGVHKDAERARKALARACALGEQGACARVRAAATAEPARTGGG